MIREQDLNTALLRASLGTTAQQDPALALLAFSLPSGPLRPLLPSLANTSRNRTQSNIVELTEFDDLLLGSRLLLSYSVTWPLDLFLHPSELQIYAALFSYLSSLRKTHTRLHTCWTSLSNAQRARRRWTGLSEGGTAEDLDVRKQLLRCGWGVVRDMGWFLDTVLGYVMTDVVDTEYRSLKNLLSRSTASRPPASASGRLSASVHSQDRGGIPPAASSASVAPGLHSGNSLLLDFTTLRTIHTTYLERVYTGCLLSYPSLSSTLRDILDTCERFVAHVERWGGDVLPALLFEGSINGEDKVGAMVQERWEIVAEINNVRRSFAVVVSFANAHRSTGPPQALHKLLRPALPLHIATAPLRRVKIDDDERQHDATAPLYPWLESFFCAHDDAAQEGRGGGYGC